MTHLHINPHHSCVNHHRNLHEALPSVPGEWGCARPLGRIWSVVESTSQHTNHSMSNIYIYIWHCRYVYTVYVFFANLAFVSGLCIILIYRYRRVYLPVTTLFARNRILPWLCASSQKVVTQHRIASIIQLQNSWNKVVWNPNTIQLCERIYYPWSSTLDLQKWVLRKDIIYSYIYIFLFGNHLFQVPCFVFGWGFTFSRINE